MSFCLETYLQQNDDYEILVQRSGVKQCYKLIEENAKEIIHVNPGDKVLGARLIGLPPIPVGINEDEGTILITYTKIPIRTVSRIHTALTHRISPSLKTARPFTSSTSALQKTAPIAGILKSSWRNTSGGLRGRCNSIRSMGQT
jgi:hypothetical protein